MINELHIHFLLTELNARKERNPRYSMRAFAAHLGLDCAALSRILNRKQTLSIALASSILKKLDLSFDDRVRFIESVAYQRVSNELSVLAESADLGDFDLELHIHRPETVAVMTH